MSCIYLDYQIVNFFTYRNDDWDDLILLESISIFNEFLILLKNIFGDPFITKNCMCHFFSSKFDIHGNANRGHTRCREHELR